MTRRVESEQVFYSDDRLRAVIESNTDGYLYVFTTENDGAPEMVFPDERLESGENRVRAHVPVEVSSSPCRRSRTADWRPRIHANFGAGFV